MKVADRPMRETRVGKMGEKERSEVPSAEDKLWYEH